ncbi:MAG TPA: hypothetical protein DCS93_21680 [Microscillaceae bacterium]|nr:hypothetical protein [Microscillaceae bacterium]
MMENLDYFDDNMQYLGTDTRKAVHAKGLWHKTIHCWVLRRGTDDQPTPDHYVVFQQRSAQKEFNPLVLDISAAGHYAAGETDQDAAREIEEELGFQVDFQALIFLGILQEANIIPGQYEQTAINREFCYTYFLEDNRPLNEYQIQEEEVADIIQIPIQEGLKLFSGESKTAAGLDRHGKAATYHLKDFLPRNLTYYLKIFIMAERYFEGKKHLAI